MFSWELLELLRGLRGDCEEDLMVELTEGTFYLSSSTIVDELSTMKV